MRILCLGCTHFSYVCTEPLIDGAGPSPGPVVRVVAKNALVLLVTVEQSDSPSQIRRAAERVKRIAEFAETPRVVIDGYAHLAQRLAPPETVPERLALLEEALKPLSVHVTPYGWTKALSFDVVPATWAHHFIHT